MFAAVLGVALVAPALAASVTPALAAPLAAAAPWLLLSDLHFDPFDDPALTGALAQAPVANWHAILARSSAAPSSYFADTNFA